ncbi:helix-turn-helix transcriptional regulator [Streptomyces sp. PLK6-54]|uniref:Helix-turn-helix transcriptional regulator n=1 Tax=Actinacidiphila acidipaludis TaxID=2873382 RepID=A0ABS7QHB4_9ACTN|nr:helix-turn-helix transcriptional regulator [Streptomyces acidipaludis]
MVTAFLEAESAVRGDVGGTAKPDGDGAAAPVHGDEAAVVRRAPEETAGPLVARPRPVPAPSPTDLLVRDIKAYIEHHLGDTTLTPTSIAAANHISVRYLHHLFRRDGRTVGAFLRERRLEHCRADLADPAQAHRNVCEIARRWGFRDPAVFNRTFKTAYGLTPGAYRRRPFPPSRTGQLGQH